MEGVLDTGDVNGIRSEIDRLAEALPETVATMAPGRAADLEVVPAAELDLDSPTLMK